MALKIIALSTGPVDVQVVHLLFAGDGRNSSENKAFLTNVSVVKIFLIIGSK